MPGTQQIIPFLFFSNAQCRKPRAVVKLRLATLNEKKRKLKVAVLIREDC